MQTWIIYAILSMIFAGLTSVFAKYGLQNVSADAGLGVRTLVKYKEFVNLTGIQLTLLILSGVTTTLGWLFYYRAMKDGLVSYVPPVYSF